ncbi:MAG: alpha/beta fold hydrolase, partial [Nitrospiraceae bacterium]
AERGLPVCIIHGTADATVPYAWGEALHRAIPRSEFHPVEGAAHGVLQWPAAAAALGGWVLRLAD